MRRKVETPFLWEESCQRPGVGGEVGDGGVGGETVSASQPTSQARLTRLAGDAVPARCSDTARSVLVSPSQSTLNF